MVKPPFGVRSYCQVTWAPVPTKLEKTPVTEPPILGSVAVKVELKLPVATSRRPGLLAAEAGNWPSTEVGTVNVPGATVVRQMKLTEVVTALLPVPVVVEELPTISTESEGLPPVQLRVRAVPRFTLLGKPPVTVSGEESVSDTLNDPTSGPTPPFKV